MNGSAFCILLGIIGTAVGGYECLKGHNYSLAAQNEATAVGRIVGVSHKGTFRYEFSASGAKVDDYSDVCATPLAPGACFNYGPVLVYYSNQPYPNSLLEDFAVASTRAYRIGKPTLAIGLSLTALTCAAIAILPRRNKREDDSESENDEGREHDDEPDAIHIVPGE